MLFLSTILLGHLTENALLYGGPLREPLLLGEETLLESNPEPFHEEVLQSPYL